jgi:hypothetical protein
LISFRWLPSARPHAGHWSRRRITNDHFIFINHPFARNRVEPGPCQDDPRLRSISRLAEGQERQRFSLRAVLDELGSGRRVAGDPGVTILRLLDPRASRLGAHSARILMTIIFPLWEIIYIE